ncbi:hypothetical protein [Paenibacillus piri]|uniref:Uncharacterized protein n=1 Tax=Paenibacillus piri TaxID=2547395 RepID=A0A4R5KNT4_9BACL|nr:hypothetical protein [Paenibacillus piri]TDF96578.1 hypothetical protein E1757_15890 [Paenibacillus piri]
MKSLSPRRVIVTGLTLALMLSGSVIYASRQPASAAEAADNLAVRQQAVDDTSKQPISSRSESDVRSDKAHWGKHMPIIEEAAAILGIDQASLQAALQDKTLVEIAKEKGMKEADLIAKLKAVRSKQIDEAVKAGKLKAEKAEKIKSGLEKHLTFMVNHKGPRFNGKHDMKHRMMPAPDKLSALLGMTEDELHAQLMEGKSLAEIAQSKGIGKEQLIAKIKEEMTPWIEKMVEHKRGGSAQKPAKP